MNYIWREGSFGNKWIGEYDRYRSPDRFLYKRGVRIDPQPMSYYSFNIKASELRKLDDLPNTASVPLVSPKLAAFLKERAGEVCQFMPTTIIAADGEIDDYQIVVITQKIDIVDYEKTKVLTMDDVGSKTFVYGYDFIRLRDIPIPHHLARDIHCKSKLYIDEELKDAILNAGFDVRGFYKPEELD